MHNICTEPNTDPIFPLSSYVSIRLAHFITLYGFKNTIEKKMLKHEISSNKIQHTLANKKVNLHFLKKRRIETIQFKFFCLLIKREEPKKNMFFILN